MTTKQLFLLLNQIHLDKSILKKISQEYNIIISSHDNYYEVSHRKTNGTQIKFKIEVNYNFTRESEYILNYRFTNTLKKIVESNKQTTNETIHPIIENLFKPVIREIKINTVLEK